MISAIGGKTCPEISFLRIDRDPGQELQIPAIHLLYNPVRKRPVQMPFSCSLYVLPRKSLLDPMKAALAYQVQVPFRHLRPPPEKCLRTEIRAPHRRRQEPAFSNLFPLRRLRVCLLRLRRRCSRLLRFRRGRRRPAGRSGCRRDRRIRRRLTRLTSRC